MLIFKEMADLAALYLIFYNDAARVWLNVFPKADVQDGCQAFIINALML